MHADTILLSELASSQRVQVRGGLSGSTDGSSSSSTCAALASVRHLPPIRLHLDIPPGYPEESPPAAQLAGEWLSSSQIAGLQQQLDRLWQEQGPGLPVGFVWIDWLQNEALQFLGLQDGLLLSGNGGFSDSEGSQASGRGSSSSRLSPSAPEWVPGCAISHDKNGKLERKASKGKSAAHDHEPEQAGQVDHSIASDMGSTSPPKADASGASFEGDMNSVAALVARLVSYNAVREIEIFKEVRACLSSSAYLI